MNKCQIKGCRSLEWKCADCGRTVSTAEILGDDAWMDVHEDGPPPPMCTVLLCIDGKVVPGWNESIQPEEDPSYCCWGYWPEPYARGDGVTHWRYLCKPPEKAP